MVRKYILLFLLCCILAFPVLGSGIVPMTPSGYSELVASPALPFIQYTPYYDNQELNYGGWNFYNEMEYGITAFSIYAHEGESGTFTISLYDGSKIDGAYIITNAGILQSNIELIFDGTSVNITEIGIPGEPKRLCGQLVISDTTNETGILFFFMTVGTDSINVFVPGNIVDTPISGLNYTQSAQNKVSIEYYDVDVARGLGGNAIQKIQEFINNVIAFFSYTFFIIISIFYWFKFIFIDNFLLTISFYILGTFALSVASSSDPFTALKKWVGYQKSLMDFFIWLIHAITDIAYSIKNIIPGLKWL